MREYTSTKVCIKTVDTDISIYGLYFQGHFESTKLYIETGSGENLRTLDISAMASALGESTCKVLPALHAFTGNDYTSAFHGIGKVKALKIIIESSKIRKAFKRIGDSFDFNAKYFPVIESFVCQMYGVKTCENVNEARYLKFFSSKSGSTEPQKLPPTRDALLLHCKRVSYVTAIIKRSLENNPDIPSPDGYGWTKNGESLFIKWSLLPPAPPQILEQITCGCGKGCKSRLCRCRAIGIDCDEFCKCKDCTNHPNHDDTTQDTVEDDDEDDGFDDDQLEDLLVEEEVENGDDVDFLIEDEHFENVLKILD